MQCKDIPDLPILEYIDSFGGEWTFMFGERRNVRKNAMPPGVPFRLAIAKMRGLSWKRGLLDGCACGCRGDFVLTDKGKEYLARLKGNGD